MLRTLKWMTLALLCCAAEGPAAESTPEARLREAQTAFEQAKALLEAGRYAQGVPYAEQALALREAALGGMEPRVADCLNLLGELHGRQADLARAEPLFQRALAIREAALGKEHPAVASSLTMLGEAYWVRGLYSQAEPLFQRALTIRESALGREHPDVAISLYDLAWLYQAQGAYSRAEPLFQRALAIREAALGGRHPLTAELLNDLAELHVRQGLYSRAEPLFQRALAIREAVLGNAHPRVAESLNGLALLYLAQGLYAQAEPLAQRALTLREALLGGSHPDVAQSLHKLAVLYLEQGLYGRAEPLLRRALAIQETAFGGNHQTVAYSLDNLALLHTRQGAYRKAEPLIKRALAIREAVFGGSHPEVAEALYKLANLYKDQGLHSRALPLYRRALAISEAALGPRHPLVAASLSGLANLYKDQGLHSRAEPLYQRALAIHEEALGGNHPLVAGGINDLAMLRLAQHRLAEAVPLLARAFTLSEARLRKEALSFSEARLAEFLQFLRADEERLYTVLRAHPEDAEVRRLALGAALLLKGRSVEETAGISRVVYRSLGEQDRDTFERLRGLRTQLAVSSLGGPGPRSPPDTPRKLAELAAQADALEADLARRSAPLRALAALPSLGNIVGEVALALPRDAALVEVIAYTERPPRLAPGTPGDRLRYLAVVLFPDASTRAVDLGPAGPIDDAALRLRNALANRDASFLSVAQRLHRLVFHPLAQALGNPRRLFLAPDGQLALVPFAALHDGRRFLIDTYNITYLGSGKDLLPRDSSAGLPEAVVVLADPDFSASPHPPAGLPEALMRSQRLERRLSMLSRAVSGHTWTPLPGTRHEAEAIQRLIPQAKLFLGAEATKDRLLRLPAPAVLHLATHGFFLGDGPVTEGSRAVAQFASLGENTSAPRLAEPLLSSGLALAGAGTPASGSSGPSPHVGLVTALELAGLDLWGTELVVLSACDTGRGEVRPGQGVYGLRRAFMVAGAETVVMSLWKVNDGTTSELMEAYYHQLLKGLGRATALREAMRALRTTRPHPHDWAPFIAAGRDAPLRAAHGTAVDEHTLR
jgi:CHAT domain-containing protein/tetratricopeptide (TPR) repeat protein